MNGCQCCGDWAGRHDPIAHDAEPQEDTVTEPTDELRAALARWLFERDYRERGLCSPEDADWDEWVERNREEWREEADALLTDSPIAEVIEQRARERAAEELETLAFRLVSQGVEDMTVYDAMRSLRDAALAAAVPPRIAHAIARVLGIDTVISMFCPTCDPWVAWAEEIEEAA